MKWVFHLLFLFAGSAGIAGGIKDKDLPFLIFGAVIAVASFGSMLAQIFIADDEKKRAAYAHKQNKMRWYWNPEHPTQSTWIAYHYSLFSKYYDSLTHVGYRTELTWEEDFITCQRHATLGDERAINMIKDFNLWRLTT